jgi:integrase/recombinase XerD
VGRRDHAVLVMLARLGLRTVEVASLGLDDVDWRSGHLLVRGKGDRVERLPLPVQVGQVLVDYLRDRPGDDCRALFVRVRAPRVGLTAMAVRQIVARACLVTHGRPVLDLHDVPGAAREPAGQGTTPAGSPPAAGDLMNGVLVRAPDTVTSLATLWLTATKPA